jgi:hypothetical protein
MIRYRIVQKDTVCEGMLIDGAQETLQQLESAFPDKKYAIEDYQYVSPEGKGIGRDPDLH